MVTDEVENDIVNVSFPFQCYANIKLIILFLVIVESSDFDPCFYRLRVVFRRSHSRTKFYDSHMTKF